MAAIPEDDRRRGFSAPNALDVTPSDTQSTMPWGAGGFADYLWVGTGGTLVLVMAGGQTITKTVTAGHWEWGRISCVNAASTATSIIGYWN